MNNAALASSAPNPYLVQAIADELALAPLLGWYDIGRPDYATRLGIIWGSHPDERDPIENKPTRTMMPRWRRSWDGAGELIAPFHLSIIRHELGVIVSAPFVENVWASFAEHPTGDDAIRWAIVQAAMSVLADCKTALEVAR